MEGGEVRVEVRPGERVRVGLKLIEGFLQHETFGHCLKERTTSPPPIRDPPRWPRREGENDPSLPPSLAVPDPCRSGGHPRPSLLLGVAVPDPFWLVTRMSLVGHQNFILQNSASPSLLASPSCLGC
uniref:Uncharacterized protein n=1 Tax=Fagus sylvatica TaxID=28930 RepID=A0A2N9JA14_FAGSY